VASFQAAERLSGHLAAPHGRYLVTPTRAFLLHALVRLGDTGHAEQALAGLGDQARGRGEIRVAVAMLRLAQGDPSAAAAALAPVLDGSAPLVWRSWLVNAFLLEAIARDTLGDPAAAGRALERALDAAEPDLILFPFLIYPARGLLERRARYSPRHAVLISEILDLLPGEHGKAGLYEEMASSRTQAVPAGSALRLLEPLSQREPQAEDLVHLVLLRGG